MPPARLRPTQQGVRQHQHDRHTGEGRRQPCRPAAKGIPDHLARQAVAQSHQPVHQRRLVETGQAVHPGGQPVTGFGHGPPCGGEQGGRFIHHSGGAESPAGDQDPKTQHQGQHPQMAAAGHHHHTAAQDNPSMFTSATEDGVGPPARIQSSTRRAKTAWLALLSTQSRQSARSSSGRRLRAEVSAAMSSGSTRNPVSPDCTSSPGPPRS